MVEINTDNRISSRDEERAEERKRAETKQNLERKLRNEPMKTFEAKLSEKYAHDVAQSDRSQRQAKEHERINENKDLMDKILNVASSEQVNEDQNLKRVHEQKEFINEDEKNTFMTEAHEDDLRETGRSEHEKKTEQVLRHESSSSEQGLSSEGHRIVGHVDSQEEKGFSGQSGQGDSSQSDKDPKEEKSYKIEASRAAQKLKTRMSFDFDKYSFSNQDLDEIVSSVHLGMDDLGREEFAVTLSNDYFEGLKIVATRAPDGVVLKFVCPNPAVRGTFLLERPKLYSRFRQSEIEILRIEVV